jgi:hypothetical protein
MAKRLRGRINPDSRMIHPRDWTWTDRRLHEMDMLGVVFDYLKIGMQVEWTQHGD